MILATHALTGAVIGKYIANPYAVVAISLAVHFAMDSFRHGEYFDSRTAKVRDTWWKVTMDILLTLFIILGTFLFLRFSYNISFNILLGAIVSMFPDLLTVLYWKFNWPILGKIKKFHEWTHRYGRFPKYSPERQWTFRNLINDIIISALAIIFLFI